MSTSNDESWIIGAEPDLRRAWVFREANELRLSDGPLPDPAVVQSCVTAGKSFDTACLAEHDIVGYTHVVYHPANRFWLFQGIEAGIFTALALALLGFSV